MIIEGYKAFNKDKTNRYNKKFEEKQLYKIDGDIKFGNNGNGFHICTSLSDVFRFFDKDVVVAKVIGFGNCVCYNDEYYGYYDMYAVSCLYVSHFLTRNEIIEKMLKCLDADNYKFLTTFILNEQERKLFLEKYKANKNMRNLVLYYQYGYKDIFNSNDIKYTKGIYKYLDILVEINHQHITNSENENIRFKKAEILVEIDLAIREFYEYLKIEQDISKIVESILNLCGKLWLVQPFYDGNTRTLKEFMKLIFYSMGYDINMDKSSIPIIPIFYEEDEKIAEKDIQNILTRLKKRTI